MGFVLLLFWGWSYLIQIEWLIHIQANLKVLFNAMIWYHMIMHFHPDSSMLDKLENEADRSMDDCREFSLECNGGAEMIFRDEGGGRDIILLFSAIL
jgi:hypothetical protein